MKTLLLEFYLHGEVAIVLRGLSFKAIRDSNLRQHTYRAYDSTKKYMWNFNYEINPKTSKPAAEKLIGRLKKLYADIPFDKIKIVGNYELTADELYKKIIENEN